MLHAVEIFLRRAWRGVNAANADEGVAHFPQQLLATAQIGNLRLLERNIHALIEQNVDGAVQLVDVLAQIAQVGDSAEQHALLEQRQHGLLGTENALSRALSAVVRANEHVDGKRNDCADNRFTEAQKAVNNGAGCGDVFETAAEHDARQIGDGRLHVQEIAHGNHNDDADEAGDFKIAGKIHDENHREQRTDQIADNHIAGGAQRCRDGGLHTAQRADGKKRGIRAVDDVAHRDGEGAGQSRFECTHADEERHVLLRVLHKQPPLKRK